MWLSVPPDTRAKPRFCRPPASAWELRSTCGATGGGDSWAKLQPRARGATERERAAKTRPHLLLVRLELLGGCLLQRAGQTADGVVVGAALQTGDGRPTV
jgi:hypothetical protein